MAVSIDLSGRTALVTGSTQGIGAAIATGLARAGARVAVNGRSPDRVREAVSRIAEEVPGADLVETPADVTSDDGTDELLEQLASVDILVNNLGVFGPKPALEITDAEWRHYFEVNVLTAVRLTRAYLPRMLEQGWGRCSTSPATPPSSSPSR